MSSSPKPTPELPPPQQGISLDELTEAFAQAMGLREESRAGPAGEPIEAPAAAVATLEPSSVAAGPPQPDSAPAPADDDACPVSPLTILEAMLFVGNRGNEPLTARQAAELMRGVKADEIADLVATLNRRYASGGYPYEVVSEGPGYRLTLRKSYQALADRFYGRVREARLSQAAIDILAVVAYQQPISADQVSKLRGRECNRVLTQLVRRGLLRIERGESKPRTPHYYTTSRFLEIFRLASLDDLPQSEEVE